MRCPKCGYTSFDNLERCKRCKKNIAATAAALMGTTFDAVPPAFLFTGDLGDGMDAPAAAGQGAARIALNKQASAAVAPTDDVVSLDETPALPQGGPAAAEPDPALDLSGMDISDLKAPAPEAQPGPAPAAPTAPVDDFSLEDLQLGDEDLGLGAKTAPAVPKAAPAPAAPKKAAPAPAAPAPAAKTGTALDSFNFDDLDELLVADEKA